MTNFFSMLTETEQEKVTRITPFVANEEDKYLDMKEDVDNDAVLFYVLGNATDVCVPRGNYDAEHTAMLE
jgi:hypothetical protein